MSPIRSRLRDMRLELGLTQQALAHRAGLTRQTIGAIEAGDYGPSLEVALRLARALDRPVDDIFALPPDDAPDVALLSCTGPTRVLSAVIGEHEVLRGIAQLGAYRWPTATADGLAEVDDAGRLTVHRFAEARRDTLFLAGCDPALGLLADHLQGRGLRAFWFSAGSGAAQAQLSARRTHLAAVHWTHGEERPRPPAGSDQLLLSRWEMGFVMRRGLSRFGGPADLGMPGLRLVNREEGSGARRLLDRLLAEAGIRPTDVDGYGQELPGHWEVADAVAQGAADVGIASGAAAAAFSLSFLPLSVETCELWWQREAVPADAVQRLGDTLASAAFRRDLDAFGPFDTSQTGLRLGLDQRGRG